MRSTKEISVLCPGIRVNNWQRLYESIKTAFSGTFELVIIGPYGLPPELKNIDNIRHIEDWGSPIRCQQIGLLSCKSDYITWAADDGIFCPGSLDLAYKTLNGLTEKNLVMGKYIEGDTDDINSPMSMRKDAYYVLSNHDASMCKHLPQGFYMLNVGLIPRSLLFTFGGWDCQFEVCPMAYNDLALRLQNAGVNFLIQDEIMFKCGHMPGHEGDHGPIHDAQIKHDQPIFNSIYCRRDSIDRMRININTYSESPERWRRRFG
jgi:hypothetical protein